MNGPAGILFDLDNTLVDRRVSLGRYAECLLRDFSDVLDHVTSAEVTQRLITADHAGHRDKMDFLAKIRAWPEWSSAPETQFLNRHYMWEFPPCAVAADGMSETVAALQARGIKLGIVTNGSARAQHGKIMALHLWRHFPCILVSATVGLRKPNTAIFALALEKLELSPNETWFVGDHPEADILGAERAGLTGVWIKGFIPWPAAQPEPRLQIGTLQELLELIESDSGESHSNSRRETRK